MQTCKRKRFEKGNVDYYISVARSRLFLAKHLLTYLLFTHACVWTSCPHLFLFHGFSRCFASLYLLIIKGTFLLEEPFLRILLTRRLYRAPCFKARVYTSVKFSVNTLL